MSSIILCQWVEDSFFHNCATFHVHSTLLSRVMASVMVDDAMKSWKEMLTPKTFGFFLRDQVSTR